MAAVDRRQEVLNAAAHSFAKYGYKATTMEQVAKFAKVGKGTIYTFFTTKEELFNEILCVSLTEMRRLAEQMLDRTRSFFDNFYRVLDVLLEFRSEHDLFNKLSQEVRACGTPQAIAALEQVEQVILGYLEREIEIALRNREIRPCEPRIIALMMLKLYIGLTSDLNKIHEPLTKEQIKHYLGLFFANGIMQPANLIEK